MQGISRHIWPDMTSAKKAACDVCGDDEWASINAITLNQITFKKALGLWDENISLKNPIVIQWHHIRAIKKWNFWCFKTKNFHRSARGRCAPFKLIYLKGFCAEWSDRRIKLLMKSFLKVKEPSTPPPFSFL